MSDPNESLISVEDSVRLVLLRDWNPLRFENDAVARARYENFVAPISRLLRGSRSREALLDYLHEAKTRELGVLDFPRARNRIAARKLLEIRIPGDDEKGR